jgi:hypothetical protein
MTAACRHQALRTFDAAARHGNFSRAGVEFTSPWRDQPI